MISGALPFINKALQATKFQQQAFVGSLLTGAVVGAITSGFLYISELAPKRMRGGVTSC